MRLELESMVPNISEIFYLEPIEELDETLECTWRALCDYFVAGGDIPDIQTLFTGVNLARSREAAETVLANMLFELAETICRFSPWYTKPTRAFGISVLRDSKTNCLRCVLAPEAAQKWEKLLGPLSLCIKQNLAVIQATIYIENLAGQEREDECVTAKCGCCPPHVIRINRSALEKTAVYCSVCQLPFA